MGIDFDNISKYFSGEMPPKEKEAFISELLENPEQLDEFSQLKNVWALARIHDKENGKKIAKKEWRIFNRRVLHKGNRQVWQWAAASILVLIGVVGMTVYLREKETPQEEPPVATIYHTLSVPAGQYTQTTLPDGSEIHLNSGSTLIYPDKFGDGGIREVQLDGEGFFKVSSDKEHPFIVKTKSMDIIATGTQFNVSAYDDDPWTTTTLREGTVNLYSLQNRIDCPIKEGQMAVYHKDINKIYLKASNFDEISWTKGEFRFKETSLEQIAKRLERFFSVTFVFEDETVRNKRFTGTFNDRQSVANILKAMKKSTKNMSYRIENDTIYINK